MTVRDCVQLGYLLTKKLFFFLLMHAYFPSKIVVIIFLIVFELYIVWSYLAYWNNNNKNKTHRKDVKIIAYFDKKKKETKNVRKFQRKRVSVIWSLLLSYLRNTKQIIMLKLRFVHITSLLLALCQCVCHSYYYIQKHNSCNSIEHWRE